MKMLRQLCLVAILAITAVSCGGGSKTGSPECDEYLNKLTKFVKECDKIPAETKAQYEQALKSAEAQSSAKLEGEAKEQASKACKQGSDTMKQAATALGCSF